jgi:hypothetical protein
VALNDAKYAAGAWSLWWWLVIVELSKFSGAWVVGWWSFKGVCYSGENMKLFLLEISDRAIKGAKIVHPFFPTKSIYNNHNYDFQKRKFCFYSAFFFWCRILHLCNTSFFGLVQDSLNFVL